MYLAPTILLWAATPLVVTELTRTLEVLWVNTFCSAAATATLALLAALRGARRTLPTPRRSLGSLAILGATGLYPYVTLQFLAYTLSPGSAGEINIVNYTWPVWVAVLSAVLLGESLGARGVAGLAVGFAGAALAITGGVLSGFRAADLPAFLCAGAGALFWAYYSVRGKALALDPLESSLVAFAASTVCLAATAVMFAPFRPPDLRELGLILLLGAGANGIGYFLWSLALRSGHSSRVSGAVYLTPIVALVYLWVFGRSTPRWYQPAALVLVVGGALIQRRWPPRRR